MTKYAGEMARRLAKREIGNQTRVSVQMMERVNNSIEINYCPIILEGVSHPNYDGKGHSRGS